MRRIQVRPSDRPGTEASQSALAADGFPRRTRRQHRGRPAQQRTKDVAWAPLEGCRRPGKAVGRREAVTPRDEVRVPGSIEGSAVEEFLECYDGHPNELGNPGE